jgi:hypothetical protein
MSGAFFSAERLYRVAAALLVLFAAGHTVGFLTFTPPTREGVAVRDAMSGVHFRLGGSTLSYGGFYRGFGFSITASTLFLAMVAWCLAGMARAGQQGSGLLGWGMCALQVVGLALSLRYFAAPPAVGSVLLIVCLGFAAWKAG